MPRHYKRKTEEYKFENLQKAIEHIRSESISLTTASQLYSVPRTTIYDRLYENVITKPRRGQKNVFTDPQEKRLEEHILKCNQLYNILTMNVVRKAAFKFAKAYNLRNNFDKTSEMAGIEWYYGFMKRHPNITVLTTRKLNCTKDGPVAFNEAEVLQFFDGLLAQDIRDNVHIELQEIKPTETLKCKRKRIVHERRAMGITRAHGNTVQSTDGDTMKKEAQELCKSENNKSALRELGKKLFARLSRKSYSPYSRIKEKKVKRSVESEPEVSWNAEIVESSDPLEALAVAGTSRYIHPTHDDSTQDKEVYDVSILVQEPLNFDIKEEITVEDFTGTPEETLADFNIVSEDEVSESDSSSNIVLSRVRSKTVSGSASSEHLKTRRIQKPKQKVTTEILFQRYKLKSKREIDRLHSKIRELKESVAKYKRQVYRLQQRRD